MKQVEEKSVQGGDESTIDTLSDFTPTESTSPVLNYSNVSTIPRAQRIFVIRAIPCRRVITLLEGEVLLSQPDGFGSVHWACVENGGRLGFRNVVTGRFLGYDKSGTLCCVAEKHRQWEYFDVRPRRDGGYTLLMTNWSSLWHVGLRGEDKSGKLAKIGEGGDGGVRWEFIEVQGPTMREIESTI